MKITPKEMISLFEKYPQKAKQSFLLGATKGLEVFKGRMIKKYYSGRPGLKRKDARLANGWYCYQSGNDAVAIANDTRYAHVHEHARGFKGTIVPKTKKALKFNHLGRTMFAKSVYIPKRTNISEDYELYASDLIIRSWVLEFTKAIKMN